MKTFDFPQRSPEWFRAKLGVITASEIGPWVAKEKRNMTDEKAAKSLIYKKLAEISGCEMQPVFENWAMQRGTELEPEARENYCLESGETVEEVGFCLSVDPNIGCSPDGLINGGEGGVEIKSPLPQTHLKYIFDGGIPAEYMPQIQHCMVVTGAAFWDFYSYCPGLPTIRRRVERDELTESYKVGLELISEEYNEHKRIMARKWDEMKAEFKKREEAA